MAAAGDRARNPVLHSPQHSLRDPAVLPLPGGGALVLYTRFAAAGSRPTAEEWSDDSLWVVAAREAGPGFTTWTQERVVTPQGGVGYASPSEPVRWKGVWYVAMQTYPALVGCEAQPEGLPPGTLGRSVLHVISTADDPPRVDSHWSAPVPFLTAAAALPWNTVGRVIDPCLAVAEDGTLCCFFAGCSIDGGKANLVGTAEVTAGSSVDDWEWRITTPDAPIFGREVDPEGAENLCVLPSAAAGGWVMLLSAGSPTHQHVLRAGAPALRGPWRVLSEQPLDFPCLRHQWMGAPHKKHGAPSAWREEGGRIAALIQGEAADGRTAFGLVWSDDEGVTWEAAPEGPVS
eukprot:TRINITY_DN72377_c0_g1_i1.p1 TRINITY_DN72377_c0_g1~~TRINITY_DN72377_c0_g1_i1.p1  ORF type:complete len:368 (+),score=102.88 TRINITY_DN72377_c0_g1_i1:69-1106(+)